MVTHTSAFIFRPRRVGPSGKVLSFSIEKVPGWVPGQAQIRRWLQRWAFRRALHQAQQRFAREYPHWQACLFDKHFLDHSAAPLLARYVQPASPPTPAELAAAWDAQVGPASPPIRQRRIAELTPAAADFLAWLEAELRPYQIFQPERNQTGQPGHAGAKWAGGVVGAADGLTVQKDSQRYIRTGEVQGQASVAVMHAHGALDSASYQDFIGQARQAYEAGGQYLILDLGEVPSIGMSGLFALYSVAVMLRGEAPPDAAAGWPAYHAMSHGLKGETERRLKLLNPQPQVALALEKTGFNSFLEVHPNLEAAIASLLNAGRRSGEDRLEAHPDLIRSKGHQE